MSLPTLAKSWLFNLNHRTPVQSSALTSAQAVMFFIKSTLIGFASNPWTVIGSCNSTVAGMDAVDRWVTGANLVWQTVAGANPRAWIVLQQTGIAPLFQVCIELTSSNPASAGSMNEIRVVTSTTGFGTANGGTNGSTITRPTALNEVIPRNPGSWLNGLTAGSNGINEDMLIYIWQSTDGQCTRIVIRRPSAGLFTAYAAFEKPKNPIAAWTSPAISSWVASVAGVMLYGLFNDSTMYQGNIPASAGGGAMPLFCTTEGAIASLVGELVVTVNDLTGSYQLTPMGLASETVGARGRHGEIFDLWYGVTALQDGDTYPANGTKQFIQMSNIALPWNGSDPIMS